MMLLPFQSILHFDSFNPSRSDPVPEFPYSFRCRRTRSPALTKAAFKRNVDNKNDKEKKPNICTADELHYVHVDKSEWKVALWRYLPSPQAPTRNHPLMLLSGVGTNAIAYDLSPESSFARFMCSQGYDTWILELRGAGLSTQGMDFGQYKDPLDSISQRKDFFEVERSSPVRAFDMQNSISTALKDMQKQLDLIAKYDWDFDNYLEEDVPAAMEYIKDKSEPKDGKLLAIGHSMGGILLYAMLSRCGYEGKDPGLSAVTTLASSLDYMSSRSSLKLLLPLADPAQVLNVPVIPIGTLLAAAHPFAANPPYLLSWLSPQISAPDMLQPKLFEKLVTENFETVPAKLLLQLATAFEEGGLRDRSGTFFYKNHLSKSNVPVLAIAGDQDLICPPDAVYETVKLIREPLVTYKVFGEPGGPHFAHYDIVGAQRAVDLVYPCIIEFLNHHDAA
ncbi:hypothetical protein ERO13_A09G050100v2 [Gossypium hirsutum]|uniref:Uncharacterized protein isoform X2 n=1 Tax=Gossypium hirsutum TaxID=3635 RepID=A0A1U8HX11_GOSHI|nr:uncharacterized protein LOC107888784 isoform X2 [Gossypium hirsutum]KAG4182535.1 hypothetical protein ERO13_A09G050100v2 [Gossypium hirsutum]